MISSNDKQGVEESYFRESLGIRSPFLFVSTLQEARMLVAGNQAICQSKNKEELMNRIIKQIPFYEQGEHKRHNYFAFWLKKCSSEPIKEFAQILVDLFQNKNFV